MGRAPSINVILWTSFMPLLGGTLKGNSAGNKFAYWINRRYSLLFTLSDASSR